MRPTLENAHPSPIEKQRELLLEMNRDMLFWVYRNLYGFSDEKISLEMLPDILTCNSNQLWILKWLDENPDITIIDTAALRKWETRILWQRHTLSNWLDTNRSDMGFTLLSNWVIELIESRKSDGAHRLHAFTSLRDIWSIDGLQRTWVAGRNISSNLHAEIDREYTEENPFLSKINGAWTLATPLRNDASMAAEDLSASLEYFLAHKYSLDVNRAEHANIMSVFEKRFKWLRYTQLWTILREIIRENRIVFFQHDEVVDLPWVERHVKNIQIQDSNWKILSSWRFFVHNDVENNTIEYRSIRRIALPEWFHPRQRLFLEGRNQSPKTHRLSQLEKEKLVPTMAFFADLVHAHISEA